MGSKLSIGNIEGDKFVDVPESIQKIECLDLDNNALSMKKQEGSQVLIVNFASKDMYTNINLNGLTTLKKSFPQAKLQVLLVPCGQFMATEPLNNTQIKEQATSKHLEFNFLGKQSINGPFTNPLYKFLRYNSDLHNKASGVTEPVTWNFEKFLVDPKGEVIEHWKTSEPLNPYELLDKIGGQVEDAI